MTKPFGTLLLELGKIDAETLERALGAQKAHGERLGEILTKLGVLSDVDRAQALGTQLELPVVMAPDYPAEPVLGERISGKFLKEAKVIPLADRPEALFVAMVDPLDSYALRALQLLVGKPVKVAVAADSEFEAAFERLYESGRSALDQLFDQIGHTPADADESDDVERLKDLASEAPVIRMVNLLVSRAIDERASDIHIEPFDNRLKVRYRVDGMLREKKAPPAHLAAAIASRIKIMARLNIAERRLAQDGRIRFQYRGREIDIRVSTVPTIHGESVVLRLLDKTGLVLAFDALGMIPDDETKFRRILEYPHGIVIVTGPTGSGKSTTLYGALAVLNQPDRKILTVEDPVEYQVEGVNQIQVKPQIGLSFAKLLRSVVRQDPDIIMIGEMRDLETAQIAVQSALTGHLVLSTLHTNDAVGAITRLLDMGVEDYLMTSTLRGIVGQRLVRRLCERCRASYRAAPELVDRLGLDRFSGGHEVVLHRPVGCEACAGIGYVGRVGVFEILALDEEFGRLILARADTARLRAAAIERGFRTMDEDGLAKAVGGVTTIEEILRVTQVG
ncbi:MAG: type II secretion system ATPase GspE [Alphaproteobacteria bacterium]